MLSHSSDGQVIPPDPLSEVLQDLRLSGVSYGRCELAKPWGISFPDQSAARFHFIGSGEAWLRTAGMEWTRLQAGDVALLPRGTRHELAHAARGATRPLEEFPLEEIGDRAYRLRGGGDGARALLFCCSVGFDEPALHPLLELMPPVLLVQGADSDATLRALLEAMQGEVLAERVGGATVLTRLADVVIAKVVRAWVENRKEEASGWLAAIRDPKIGRALAAIHRRPGEPWSVDALADIAHASRSIFSERFTSLVGVPAARYLARWRMHLASVWLQNERLSVAEVAERLGYESEAAFSRAFKRLRGVPPSALRRRPAQPGAAS